MRIAIVTPHPSPLVLGGAENLFWGLQEALRQAGHECEIIGQIGPERTLREVLTSYLAFADLDLSAYDCVISGKYPAWMAQHRDHRLYMLHRLRGLYDTYGGGPLGAEAAALPEIAALRPGGPGAPLTADLRIVRRSVETFLARGEAELPSGATAFPGPIARMLVQALDGAAINDANIARYAAISATVADRSGYFPPGVAADVLHPPPHRQDYRIGGAEHFFTSSRLDGPKRIALLIEAMRLSTAEIPLLIAGTGPESERLEALAGGDPRVRFLGFVPDEAMPDLYADALAVPFIPFDEDYGLVTLEAMKSGKPVLTATDSGGPCEFVSDGVTGLVCAPTPSAIAAGLSRLAADRDASAEMGRAAARRAAPVTWENVVAGLIGRPRSRPGFGGPRRRKLVVATTLPIFPPRGGGQARVFHLYRNVAKTFDVTIVSFGPPNDAGGRREIAPGLQEVRVATSRTHDRFERRLMLAMSGIPIGDVAMPRLSALTPDYRDLLRTASRTADAVVACHPYLVHEIEAAAPGRPLWFEAQDVEWTLKSEVFAGLAGHGAILADIKEAEGRCWREAKLVFGCTQADLTELRSIYGPTEAETLEVPNGVALDEIAFTPPLERLRLRERFGFGPRTVALFLGSWHPPNLDAVSFILDVAPAMPDVVFLVAGSAGEPFRERTLAENVRLLGVVSHEMRGLLLASADVGLNPMTYGSGSNLKMLDYFAAGLPVVSTPFGARGIDARDGREALLRPLDGFAAAIAELGGGEASARASIIEAAYALARDRYSWEAIAARLVETATEKALFRA